MQQNEKFFKIYVTKIKESEIEDAFYFTGVIPEIKVLVIEPLNEEAKKEIQGVIKLIRTLYFNYFSLNENIMKRFAPGYTDKIGKFVYDFKLNENNKIIIKKELFDIFKNFIKEFSSEAVKQKIKFDKNSSFNQKQKTISEYESEIAMAKTLYVLNQVLNNIENTI